MGAKKKSSSSEKQLKATNKKLKAKLDRADAKASRWQKKAKKHQVALAASQKRVTRLEKKLAEARRTATQSSVTRDVLSAPTEVVAAETSDTAGQPTSTPDMSWTVVRLRAEARARDLTGLSSKPKAQILAALSGVGRTHADEQRRLTMERQANRCFEARVNGSRRPRHRGGSRIRHPRDRARPRSTR